MKFIAVDDERLMLDSIAALIRKVQPQADIALFSEYTHALNYLKESGADVALLDVEMPEMNGIELARCCKKLCPEINIIFVTGHTQYTMDALKLRASGYLLKPVREADLQAELENLRRPSVRPAAGKLRIQTFGNFDLFSTDAPVLFSRSKAKEILAILVDRNGAAVTLGEIASLLWEDGYYSRSRQNQMQVFITDLMRTLKVAGADDVVARHRNALSLCKSKVSCDYYDFLNGDVSAINSYFGEYMKQYSWAEFTTAWLDKKLQ